MSNERNAGRKPILSKDMIVLIEKRYLSGESLSAIAEEYGVSRQALYKRLRQNENASVKIDYVIDGQRIAEIDADFNKRNIRVINYAQELSKLPFGFRENPNWRDFCEFAEREYLKQLGVTEPGTFLIMEGRKTFRLDDIDGISIEGVDSVNLPVFEFQKKDILTSRTDTDGFQIKALSSDRKFFIKSQAMFSGIPMRDWAVEVIASDIAKQLGIPCVEQFHCRCAFGKKAYDGVYSNNFELDGYRFISFDSLIEDIGLSTKDSTFVKLSAIDKLKWCAKQLSEVGDIDYNRTLKYMLDLAVLDCLVGNVDRHTRNFGLFYHTLQDKFYVPLVFDNGMGLFENDYYRDEYKTFEEAMHNVYVSPYGEDPFELLQMLDKEFCLKKIYKGVERIEYLDILYTKYAREYERRMQELWQKFD